MSPGLYIHIPFCRSKCFYCDFYSIADRPERIEGYVSALKAEMSMRNTMMAGRHIETIFFGGGTPSLLTPEQVASILHSCRSNFAITLDAEITMEMNPESVTIARAKGYRAAGVNRASLGIQSFIDEELYFLQRTHTADEARGAVATLQNAGFANISIDLIFGLPGQTGEQWRHTLDEALSLDAAHLSCYELTPEPNTLFGQAVAKGELCLDEETRIQLYDLTERFLTNAGYDHYEVSNYAQPGYECRHNLGYWNYDDYLGFGAAAHGCVDGVRYANRASLDDYLAGKPPATEQLSAEMMRTERLMLGLRLRRGISTASSTLTPAMERLISEELLIYADGNLRSSPRGFRLLDSVLSCL